MRTRAGTQRGAITPSSAAQDTPPAWSAPNLRKQGLCLLGLTLLLSAACSTAPTPPAATPVPAGASPSAAAVGPSPSLAVAGPSPSAAASPSLDQIVAAAKQEGALQLVWGETPFGGQDTVNQWIAGYKQMYGLDIDVSYTVGTEMSSFADSSIQEYQANKPASSDIIIGAATIMDDLIHAGDVQDGQWTAWAPNIQNPALVAPGGIGVHFAGYFPGIEYNTQVFPGDSAPQTMQDLLKPAFTGKVATTPSGAHFDELASPDVWGQQKALAYAQQFAGQLAGLMRCGDDNRVISGEFPAFAFACGSFSVTPLIAQGAPLGYVVPSDAAIMDFWYMAIPKNSAHPNAAKLWINYILSPEGQQIMWNTANVDDPLVPGSHTAQQAADLQAKGANLISIDVSFYERNAAEMKDALAQELKLFQVAQ